MLCNSGLEKSLTIHDRRPISLSSCTFSTFRFPDCSTRRRHFLLWPEDIWYRSHRCNAERVQPLVALGIMLLDMLKLRRASERLMVPIQLPQPTMQRRISRAYIPNVAFEVLHVHDIETRNRDI